MTFMLRIFMLMVTMVVVMMLLIAVSGKKNMTVMLATTALIAPSLKLWRTRWPKARGSSCLRGASLFPLPSLTLLPLCKDGKRTPPYSSSSTYVPGIPGMYTPVYQSNFTLWPSCIIYS